MDSSACGDCLRRFRGFGVCRASCLALNVRMCSRDVRTCSRASAYVYMCVPWGHSVLGTVHAPSDPLTIHLGFIGDGEVIIQKTGLGSSAALVTSLVGALLQFFGVVDLSSPCFEGTGSHAETLQGEAGQRAVHNLAQACHALAQGKVCRCMWAFFLFPNGKALLSPWFRWVVASTYQLLCMGVRHIAASVHRYWSRS